MEENNFSRYIFPVTLPGKWSIALIGFFMLFLLIHNIMIITGQRGGLTFFSNPWLAASLLGASLSAIVSFFTGILAVVKYGERSIFVILCSLIGLMVLVGVIGMVINTA